MDPAAMTVEERAEYYSKKVQGADKISRPADAYVDTPVAPGHGSLEPVFDGDGCDLWVVRGLFAMIPYVLSLPTTMTVHRDVDGGLTLFNALRVSPEVEDAMLALGPVKRVVKLGQFHGAADAYYVRCPKFGTPLLWTLDGGTTAPGLDADQMMTPSNVPIPGSLLYNLEGIHYPEAVITVPCQGRGMALIACDTLVHMTDTVGVPLIGKGMLNVFGFLQKPKAPAPPPIWLRTSVRLSGKTTVEKWYADILELDFSHIVCAHGTPVVDVSHEAIADAVKAKLSTY